MSEEHSKHLLQEGEEAEKGEIIPEDDRVSLEEDEALPLESGQNSALQRLFDHYMNFPSGDGMDLKRETIFLGLELLGSSAGVYYWPPSIAYTKFQPDWLKYSLAVGNTVSGALFLVYSTDLFLRTISLESTVPHEISDIIELSPTRDIVQKNVKILIGSLVCSVPIALVAYLYPLSFCTSQPCKIGYMVHSAVANAVFHAIPWYLILTPSYWYYRIPFLPFQWGYAQIEQCLAGEEKKILSSLVKQKKIIYKKYRTHLIELFKQAVEKTLHKQVNSDYLESITLESLPTEFLGFIQQAQLPVAEPPRQADSYFRRCLDSSSQIMSQKLIPFGGAVFLTVGLSAWLADPFYVGSKILGLNTYETVAFASLPSYTMGVLTAFYGTDIFSRVYNWLTSGWSHPKDKFPAVARRYPKVFGLFTLINAYMGFFSYSTAQEMILTIFGDEVWDAYRPYIQDVAYPALQVLCFVALMDVFVLWIEKGVALWGAEEAKLLMQLKLKAKHLIERLEQIKGKALMQSLHGLSEVQKQVLRIDTVVLTQDQDTLNSLESQAREQRSLLEHRAGTYCERLCFFRQLTAESKPQYIANKLRPFHQNNDEPRLSRNASSRGSSGFFEHPSPRQERCCPSLNDCFIS